MQLQPKTARSPKPRWPLMVVSAIFVVVAAAGIYGFLWDRDQNPTVIVREDPVADLLGWIPATDEMNASFSVWTPDAIFNSPGNLLPSDRSHGEALALEPSPVILRNNAHDITSWAMAGTSDPITVVTGNVNQVGEVGYETMEYRGASISVPAEGSGNKETIGFLANRVIIAKSVDQVKAAIDAAVGKRPSLATIEPVESLLETVAPANALMVVDAAHQAVACAGGDESEIEPSEQFVAVAYGRIGEAGEPRTMVALSYPTEEEAASDHTAYQLGWQDGYVLAGNSGAPIANFAKVNHVSQSRNLLIAELVEGREDGWTRAAVRLATPVCEAVSEALPDGFAATPAAVDQENDLSRVLALLPDPGMEGVTLAAAFPSASRMTSAFPPTVEGVLADEIEAWLEEIGPLPDFTAFPSDGTQLARWPETLGISLGSISALAETRGNDVEQTAAVMIGTWDPELVEDRLSHLGFLRTNYGDATIFAFGGDLDDPGNQLNRAAGPTWSNVALVGDLIFLSPSSRTLREILDIATGDQSAPAPLDNLYLRDRFLAGAPDITMLEIVGREYMSNSCVDEGVTGIAPSWYGAAALWRSSDSGGSGEIMIIPEENRPLADVQREFSRQITQDRTVISADGQPSAGPFGEMFGYQEMQQTVLSDGSTVLRATFSPPMDQSGARFFVEGFESRRFCAP